MGLAWKMLGFHLFQCFFIVIIEHRRKLQRTMAFSTTTRTLLVGATLLFSTGLLLEQAVQFLSAMRRATRVTRDEAVESTPPLISRRTEDAIKTETLGTLYESPNHDIRQA